MKPNLVKRIVPALLVFVLFAAMSITCFADLVARDWAWPVPGITRLSSCFGDGRNHNAIDIVADRGTPIAASYAGTVVKTYKSCTKNYVKSGNCTCGGCYNLGNYIYIEHSYAGKTYVSRYGHLTDVYVTVGDVVTTGQIIGTMGCTGRSTGDHLDFQIYEGTYSSRVRYVDPLKEPFVMPIEGFNASGSVSSCCYSYVAQVQRILNGEQYYLDYCKVTSREQKTFICGADCGIMSYPCTTAVFSNSYQLGTIKKGEQFTATQQILNSKSESWLKLTTASGITGYVPLLNALDYKLNKAISKVEVPYNIYGYAAPDTSSAKISYAKGKIITFVGYVRDGNGKSYFMSTDGYFFPTNTVEPEYQSSLKINGKPYAYGTLTKGSGFQLSGTISSENTITGIEAYVCNQKGKTVLSKYISLRTDSVDIAASEINSAMKFGTLGAGKYTFTLVISEEANGYNENVPFQTTLVSDFTVGGANLMSVTVTDNDGYSTVMTPGDTYTSFSTIDKISLVSYNVPTNMKAGSLFSISGTVLSAADILTDITVSIINSDGKVVQTKSYDPNSTTGNIAKLDADIKFGSLPVGNYTYQVKATNSSCTEVLISSPFAVYVAGDMGSLDNITEKRVYDGRFTDVAAKKWYSKNIEYAYSLNLLNGKSATTFDPNGLLTVAECITLAVNLNCAYKNITPEYTGSGKWYEKVARYALENGIIKHGYTNYKEQITRAEAMYIFANCLTGDAFSTKNIVPDGAIADCPTDSDMYSAVYTLYRAGIITGVNNQKDCAPNELLTRAEAATIVVRIAKRDRRVSVSF